MQIFAFGGKKYENFASDRTQDLPQKRASTSPDPQAGLVKRNDGPMNSVPTKSASYDGDKQ
jgi:hypothetical protein